MGGGKESRAAWSSYAGARRLRGTQTCTVPTSSMLSSGLVPMKSKERHARATFRASAQMASECCAVSEARVRRCRIAHVQTRGSRPQGLVADVCEISQREVEHLQQGIVAEGDLDLAVLRQRKIGRVVIDFSYQLVENVQPDNAMVD